MKVAAAAERNGSGGGYKDEWSRSSNLGNLSESCQCGGADSFGGGGGVFMMVLEVRWQGFGQAPSLLLGAGAPALLFGL